MIEVERLSRRYGTVKAVDGVTFAIGRGETEMRVSEYLAFRARLKDVPRARRREAINHVIERCNLGKVEDRIVGQLSKGYRQRVGLAEAMVHMPDILILDEPTAGLDPVQVREVRALIRELGDQHTILLSTHIMPEVEAVCSRVIIIERGRIAVDDALDNLRSDSVLVLEVRGADEPVRRSLEAAPGVARVNLAGKDGDFATFEVQAEGGADLREALASRVLQSGWSLRRLDIRRNTLEERFIQAVTQRAVTSELAREAG
jgi:ABC-2 type transport system ATP-binding protein